MTWRSLREQSAHVQTLFARLDCLHITRSRPPSRFQCLASGPGKLVIPMTLPVMPQY